MNSKPTVILEVKDNIEGKEERTLKRESEGRGERERVKRGEERERRGGMPACSNPTALRSRCPVVTVDSVLPSEPRLFLLGGLTSLTG